MAQNVKRTFCDSISGLIKLEAQKFSYIVGVILLQKPTPTLVYLFVALTASAHS